MIAFDLRRVRQRVRVRVIFVYSVIDGVIICGFSKLLNVVQHVYVRI